MATNQESKFISALNFTAQKGKTYNEAMQNMFQLVSGGDNTWNGDAINYLKDYLGSSQNNINALLNEFAVNLGFNNWDSCNNMGDPLLYSSNLKLWLDSGDSTTFTYGTSNKISQWDDKSGNGNNLSQPTSVYQPSYVNDAINNLPGIMFDGTDDNLTTSFVDINNSTIIIVYKLSSIAPPFYLFDGINELERHALWNFGMFSGSGSYNAPVWDLSPQIITASFNGANSVLYYGGVQIGPNNTGSNILSGITLGARVGAIEALEGYIGEFIVYNRVLDNNERQIIERYLSKKWGI